MNFSSQDEVGLHNVLQRNPSDIIDFIRRSMQQSGRRLAQFRNSVTYVAIILQSSLQSKTISPSTASQVIECLMKECVPLRQPDIAHLLFRAAVRFEKFGKIIRSAFLKHLYQSYKPSNSAENVLRNIGEELKLTNSHLSAIALLLAGDESAVQRFSVEDASHEDLEIFIQCCGLTKQYSVTYDLLSKLDTKQWDVTKLNTFFCAAVCASKESTPDVEKILDLGKPRDVVFSDAACAVVLSGRIKNVQSVAIIAAEEAKTKKELKISESGPITCSVIIALCGDLQVRHSAIEDHEYVAEKLNSIVQYFDDTTTTSTLTEHDTHIAVAIIRGHGALGNAKKIEEFMSKVGDFIFPNVHRLYDEAMRWYAYLHCVKEAIALKNLMTEKRIYHTIHAYHSLFRVFDVNFPHLVHKYYQEMRDNAIRLDSYVGAVLIRCFSMSGDWNHVESVYGELKHSASKGFTQDFTARVIVQMLRSYHTNPERCKEVMKDAERFGLTEEESVQTEYLACLTSHHQQDELNEFFSRVKSGSSSAVYAGLLKVHMKKNRYSDFAALLKEVESKSLWDERILLTVIQGLSHFNDLDGVKKYIEFAAAQGLIRTSLFFSEAATSLARLGTMDEVVKCWSALLESKLAITMAVYNRFLDLFMKRNNIPMVQEVIDTMMRLTPPNSVTATTVLTMLGKMGRLDEMESVLDSMSSSSNARPTLDTLHAALNAFASVGNVSKMEETRKRIILEGFIENAVTYNILVEGFAKAKRYERIAEVLRERKNAGVNMDETSFLTLLAIYSREKLATEIEQLVEDIISSGTTFSNRLLAFIAGAFASISNTTQMEKFVSMLLSHPECSSRDVEMVCSMYAKLRDTLSIQKLLDNPALVKTEKLYNVCIVAFAKATDYAKVAAILMEMEKHKFKLHRPTTILLSSLLVQGGKADLAQAVLSWNGEKSSDVQDISTPHDADSAVEDCLKPTQVTTHSPKLPD